MHIFGIVTTVLCVVVVIYELGEGCDKSPCSFSRFSALIRQTGLISTSNSPM
jgi:hypothetical protein